MLCAATINNTQVAYVWIQMANSPRPAVWALDRSTDLGQTWQPWQYFAESPAQCEQYFGLESLQPIIDDDNVICTTEFSKIVPIENGEVRISL
jgi:laminin alpha 3/5